MVIVLVLYGLLIYLLFFKFKILPKNALTGMIVLLIGIILSVGFLAGLRTLTPQSSHAAINGVVVEIAPQVSGRVASVDTQRTAVVEAGELLFTIDPTRYQAIVDQLQANLALSELRLEQYRELAEANAASRFQFQQQDAEVKRLQAQLDAAQFDLDNTKVRAPFKGTVPSLYLREGLQVSPGRSVMSLVDTEELMLGAVFQQKALESVKVGDKAMINFAGLPGRLFEARVAVMPIGIGDAQVMPTGTLPMVASAAMTRLYPIYIELPEDYPKHMRKLGLSATVYIHTENAGVVAPVALAAQWMASALDTIL